MGDPVFNTRDNKSLIYIYISIFIFKKKTKTVISFFKNQTWSTFEAPKKL